MNTFTSIAVFSIVFLVESKPQLKAYVDLKIGNSIGKLEFSQSGAGSAVKITGTLKGLSPGEHGFHVHAVGDIIGGDCATAGGHYNPHSKKHGGPKDDERHVGDLGNIKAGSDGVAKVDITDNKKLLSLVGDYSIIGKGFVVHVGVDDLGKGGQAQSLTTGNAGGRFACGKIMKEDSKDPDSGDKDPDSGNKDPDSGDTDPDSNKPHSTGGGHRWQNPVVFYGEFMPPQYIKEFFRKPVVINKAYPLAGPTDKGGFL